MIPTIVLLCTRTGDGPAADLLATEDAASFRRGHDNYIRVRSAAREQAEKRISERGGKATGPHRQQFVDEVRAPHTGASGASTYETIDKLARLLSEAVTDLKTKSWAGQHGQWGIFHDAYQHSKTRFIYDELQRARDDGRVPAHGATACEVGFLAGHTALLFAEALGPKSSVVSFDFGDTAWALDQGTLMSEAYGERFKIIFGDSNRTVPKFHRTHPELRCDVAFIDGAKYPRPRLADIVHFKAMSRAGTLIFFDEATTFACVSGKVDEGRCGNAWDGAPRAFNRASRAGLVQVTNCSVNPIPTRGRYNDWAGRTDNVCSAKYL